jgi:hypothetical protein
MLSASRGFKLPGWAGVKDAMAHGYAVRDMRLVVAGLSGAEPHLAAGSRGRAAGPSTRCRAGGKQDE